MLTGCTLWRFGRWALGEALGHSILGWAGTVLVGPGPISLFQLHKDSSNIQQFKLWKYKTLSSWSPKISRLGKEEDKFERNNFPLGKKFKLWEEFELKILKAKQIWI
jgi:hypothetical protein